MDDREPRTCQLLREAPQLAPGNQRRMVIEKHRVGVVDTDTLLGTLDYGPVRVAKAKPRRNALIFQVDLWSAHGPLPENLVSVATRQKDVQYSSRTRFITDYMNEQQNFRRMLSDVLALVPPARRDSEAFQRAAMSSSSSTATNRMKAAPRTFSSGR